MREFSYPSHRTLQIWHLGTLIIWGRGGGPKAEISSESLSVSDNRRDRRKCTLYLKMTSRMHCSSGVSTAKGSYFKKKNGSKVLKQNVLQN